MSEVPPEEYLANFRAGCEAGTVPMWFAIEILLRKTASWGPEVVLAHSHPDVVREMRLLAAAIVGGQQDEAVASWQDAENEEVRAGLRLLVEYVSSAD